jgi:ABC-type amino acid transport substrate-binding protein
MKRIFIIIFLCSLYSIAHADLVKIGIPLFAPPYAIDDKANGPQGSDVELMRNICTELKWDCQFVPLYYSKLLPALQTNDIDYAIGALVITPEKQENYLLSIPYLPSEGGFLLMENSPINSIAGLKGKRIGALNGKEYFNYIVNRFGNDATIVPYDILTNLILDLKDGKIDAIFMNYLGALYLEHQYPDRIKVLKENFPVGGGLGIATLPTNTQGIQQINKVLLKFESDGTFVKSYNYTFEFFTADASPE